MIKNDKKLSFDFFHMTIYILSINLMWDIMAYKDLNKRFNVALFLNEEQKEKIDTLLETEYKNLNLTKTKLLNKILCDAIDNMKIKKTEK